MTDNFIDDEPVDEALVNGVVATMASMDVEERAKFAKLLGVTIEELNRVIANWKQTLS